MIVHVTSELEKRLVLLPWVTNPDRGDGALRGWRCDVGGDEILCRENWSAEGNKPPCDKIASFFIYIYVNPNEFPTDDSTARMKGGDRNQAFFSS
jgi:hypothetical protein